MSAGIVQMFDAVDVVDWRTENETGEHYTDGVVWLAFLHVFPDGEFREFLAGAVTDIRILSLTRMLYSDLNHILSRKFLKWGRDVRYCNL